MKDSVRTPGGWFSSHLVLLVAFIVMLGPVLFIFLISIKTRLEALATPPSLIFTPTFENYMELFGSAKFLHRLFNSFITASITTIIVLTISVPAAYVFSRLDFRFKNVILVGILASRIIPPISLLIPYYRFYAQLNLLDTRVGLVLVFTAFNLGLGVWTMWTFFDEIPQSLDESARIAGASVLQVLRKILLPLAAPGLVSTGIIVFTLTWNNFIFALTLTRYRSVTLPVFVTQAMAYSEIDLGRLTSSALMVSLPALIFAVVARRYIQRGLLGGAFD